MSARGAARCLNVCNTNVVLDVIFHPVASGTFVLSVHGTKINSQYSALARESEAWSCTGIYAVEAHITKTTVVLD